MGEGGGGVYWDYTINCECCGRVLRFCCYYRIKDTIPSGERTLKYGQHDFEVSEALMTCSIHQYNSQSGAGLNYYILIFNHILRSARSCIRLI